MPMNHSGGGSNMLFQQRERLNKLITDMHAGRMTRRTFFKRAMEIGLASGTVAMLLEACEPLPFSTPSPTASNSPGTIPITWLSETDTNETFNYLAKKFSNINPRIQVTHNPGPESSTALHDIIVSQLEAHKGSPDVLSLDVVWTSEFASKNWIVPLDQRWPKQERTQRYLPKPLEAASTDDGQIWAAPLHTDVGLLYYRTDLEDIFTTHPTTW